MAETCLLSDHNHEQQIAMRGTEASTSQPGHLSLLTNKSRSTKAESNANRNAANDQVAALSMNIGHLPNLESLIIKAMIHNMQVNANDTGCTTSNVDIVTLYNDGNSS